MLDAERLENTLLKRQSFYAKDSALSVLAHPPSVSPTNLNKQRILRYANDFTPSVDKA